MGKRRELALLIAAGILVAAFAALPAAVSAWQDERTIGKPRYENAPAMELVIRSDTVTPAAAGLAMMQKLDGIIEIPESMASMTREEAQKRALAVLESYIHAGLAEEMDPEFYEVRCCLVQAMGDPSLNQVVWFIYMTSPKAEAYAEMDVAIADDSGYVLNIDYARDQPYTQAERENMLPIFAEVFFRSLELYDYAGFITTDMVNPEDGENNCAVRYRFGDVAYGEINLNLYVYEYGFYTEFAEQSEAKR